MHLGGAILTGGASRRMGRPKAVIEIDGRPMGAIVADVLTNVGCDPVIAVGGDPDVLHPLGLQVVADSHPGTGPVGGLLSALDWFATHRRCEWVVVTACDLPGITDVALRSLCDAAVRSPAVDVVVAEHERLEPALALWNIAARAAIRSIYDADERALHRTIGRLDHVVVPVDAAAVVNMNTPDDLRGYPHTP